MTKENLACEFASRDEEAEIGAAAKNTTKDIDRVSTDLGTDRTGWIAVCRVLLTISLCLSLFLWLPARAWSQPKQEGRSSVPQLDRSGGRPAAVVGVEDHLEVDVGLEQRHAHVAQRFRDALLGQFADAGELLPRGRKALCEGLEHGCGE